MNYRLLGKSGLQVSEIGLGCNQFGSHIDEKGTTTIVRKAFDLGINFFDTANNYPRGDVADSTGTSSEECLGVALKGIRNQIVLATKGGGPLRDGPNGGRTASRYHLMQQLDNSLRRLQTDHIDLYQLHVPDPRTPIEETLRTFDDFVRSGKVRYIGCTHFSESRLLVEAMLTSRMFNLNHFISAQDEYSLIYRKVENEVLPYCRAEGLGFIPFRPIAGGFLTGKYQKGKPIPTGTRGANSPDFPKTTLTDRNFAVLSKLEAFAKKRGAPLGQIAIAWLLANPAVSTVIAGATRLEQVAENAAVTDLKLTSDEKKELDDATVWKG